jgi:hypothetical protein
MKPEDNPKEYLLAAMERQAQRAKSWIEDSIWMEPIVGRTWWGDSQSVGGSAKRMRKRKPPAKEPKTLADVARILERRKK